MFRNYSHLLLDNPDRLHYGIAVSDVDRDGAFELFVAGFGGANLVLKWNGEGFANIADPVLADPRRRAIGVATGDLDGDGWEEIYVLNTDTFSGRKQFGDRLFRYQNGSWLDLCSRPEYRQVLNLTAGRSVACVDRFGNGRYGFFVANYGGPMRLYELHDTNGVETLVDVAPQAGLAATAGGRGLVSLPLVTPYMDIFAANENGPNFLFCNRGDGTYEETALEAGVADVRENGRGVAFLDADGDGKFDLVYGNWEGHHRLFLQGATGHFRNVAPEEMARPSRIRTVIAADFDNDGVEELFFNNIGEPNRLFGLRDGSWRRLDVGEAWEPDGLGTGAAVGDFDGDGQLELAISHGESGTEPLSLYRTEPNNHYWLRVLPLTIHGAPARGAVCALIAGGSRQIRAIDAGSGYLCQMEPVAHFGLGTYPRVERLEICWPGGEKTAIDNPTVNQLIRVPHPSSESSKKL
ncbi:MAG: CRTAC1 family protein [Cyanobacteriota bacterium]|nr:CRTAC1 family protein [Cyanobacteriota bacterium]